MEITAGTVIADRFRLVCALGQGGMGAVWLARHTALGTPCAVKFIHEQAARSPELRARFEREARAAALLRSPHVVQILDHGVWQSVPYIAMEYLEGEDLGQRLGRCGVLSPHETLALAVQIGRALTRAHAAGLVHRDIKPGNIFIVRDEDQEIAKVLDFGVAKVGESGLDGATKTGVLLGTPFYMSPEQTRGSKDVDHRSDLWALAVVIYQCLTGRLPFVAEGLYELFTKIVTDPLPVPSEVAPVPPGFDAWWSCAAARDPGQRFQTARELTDALGAALGVIVPGGMDVRLGAAEPAALAALPGAAPPSRGGATPCSSGALTPSGASISARRATPPLSGGPVGIPATPRRWLGGTAIVAALAALGLGALALHLRSGERAGAARMVPPPSAGIHESSPAPSEAGVLQDAGAQEAGVQDAGTHDAGARDAGREASTAKQQKPDPWDRP